MSDKTATEAKSLRDCPDLVTVQQVARYAQVSRSLVYKLIATGELKAKRIRSIYRLNRDEVCAYFGL